MKHCKVYYPECMRRPYKARVINISYPAADIADGIHMAVTGTRRVKDLDGNEGWDLSGTRAGGDFSNPVYADFIVLRGNARISPGSNKVNVYCWNDELWVRGTRGASKPEQKRGLGFYGNSGSRVPADRHVNYDMTGTVLLPLFNKYRKDSAKVGQMLEGNEVGKCFVTIYFDSTPNDLETTEAFNEAYQHFGMTGQYKVEEVSTVLSRDLKLVRLQAIPQ